MPFVITATRLPRDVSEAACPGSSAIAVQAYLEDYRVVDGVKIAHTMRQVTPMFTMVMRLTEVKHNVTLDDKMFKKPGGQ